MIANQLKAPFATLLTKIRHCKSQSHKQLLAILSDISQLKNSSSPTLTKQQIAELFEQAKNRLRQLRQSIKQQQQADKQLYATCKKRIKREHPGDCPNPQQIQAYASKAEGINNSNFKSQQYNTTLIGGCAPEKWELTFTRQILHYLFCRYEPEYGQQFLSAVIQAAGSTIDIDDLEPELSTLQKGLQICAEISRNQLSNIKVWTDSHNNFLLKIKSPLKFNLAACQFINEININATSHSKGSAQTIQLQKLAESARKLRKKLKDIQLSPKQQKEVQYLTMLLIRHDTQKIDQVPPSSNRENGCMQLFQELMRRQNSNNSQPKQASKTDVTISLNQKRVRRQQVGCSVVNHNKIQEYLIKTYESFKEAFQQIYEIPLQPLLTRTILVGIMVLKGDGCHKQNKSQNKKCPICTKEVAEIDQSIPKLFHEGSTLICRINGSVMTAMNYPVVMPNGQIYSISGLQSTQKNNQYLCQVTNQQFKKQKCKKIFLA